MGFHCWIGIRVSGASDFRLHGGQEYRLRPVFETPDAQELFFIFRDLTSAKETYGAGRFLYSDLPKDGKIVLDFNRAYNPPCAFTPYATCPLPPKENHLATRIEFELILSQRNVFGMDAVFGSAR